MGKNKHGEHGRKGTVESYRDAAERLDTTVGVAENLGVAATGYVDLPKGTAVIGVENDPSRVIKVRSLATGSSRSGIRGHNGKRNMAVSLDFLDPESAAIRRSYSLNSSAIPVHNRRTHDGSMEVRRELNRDSGEYETIWDDGFSTVYPPQVVKTNNRTVPVLTNGRALRAAEILARVADRGVENKIEERITEATEKLNNR